MDVVDEEEHTRPNATSPFLEHQWYTFQVYISLMGILSGMDRVRQSHQFHRTFPQPRAYEQRGSPRQAWIESHYAFYKITLFSMFDVVLIRTNAVFRLGHCERDCTHERIMKHSAVQGTPVHASLAALKKRSKDHEHARHLDAHRGRVPDIAAALDSEAYDWWNLACCVQELFGKPPLDKEMVALTYQGYTQQLCEQMQGERDKVHDSLWQLFDTLSPIYDEQFTAICEQVSDALKKE